MSNCRAACRVATCGVVSCCMGLRGERVVLSMSAHVLAEFGHIRPELLCSGQRQLVTSLCECSYLPVATLPVLAVSVLPVLGVLVRAVLACSCRDGVICAVLGFGGLCCVEISVLACPCRVCPALLYRITCIHICMYTWFTSTCVYVYICVDSSVHIEVSNLYHSNVGIVAFAFAGSPPHPPLQPVAQQLM